MSIIRVKHNQDFVVMNKTGLEDSKLSFKAKGLLAYLLSKPDNWTANISHLKKVSTNGRDSVRTGLKELEDRGYLQRNPIRNDDGTIKEWESVIFEMPVNSPETENPTLDNPTKENTTLINNDCNNNDSNKKTNNNKTQPISKKFKEVFEKTLSVEVFEKLKSIYDDLDIIYKAILVTEKRTKGIPAISYLFKILQNWSDKDLSNIDGIDKHLKQRKDQKSKVGKNNPKNKDLHDIENLEKRGWNN